MPSLFKKKPVVSNGLIERKLSRSTKSSSDGGAEPTNMAQSKCYCCGTILCHPHDVVRFKCAVCKVTIRTVKKSSERGVVGGELTSVSLLALQKLSYRCSLETRTSTGGVLSTIYQTVSDYLGKSFGNASTLQRSFLPRKKHELIDYGELSQFYMLIANLPTKGPLRTMLAACNELLKAPHGQLEDFRWLLIIWFNPIVRQGLIPREHDNLGSARLHSLSYEVAKRCIGYQSNITGPGVNKLIHYLKYLPHELFRDHVETVNLYITLQMSRFLNRRNSNVDTLHSNHLVTMRYGNTDVNHVDKNMWDLSSSAVLNPNNAAFKLSDYGHDWHIRSASRLMRIYHAANIKRENLTQESRLASSAFYNVMFDFIDFKQDFEYWRGYGHLVEDALRQLMELRPMGESEFSLCKYPFLLSLGIKKAIMELEARQIMSKEAENAFLNSMDRGTAIAVYLRIKVRRDLIEKDSLQCIQKSRGDLLKSLKVEFIGEPGVDAGGLRKEWFSLLTKSLLSYKKNLFSLVAESRYLWFSCRPLNVMRHRDDKMYFLLGTVLGLAIFHGTILDVQFPLCFYKKLCGQRLSFADYIEVYPQIGRNLIKMLNYDKDDFIDVFGLTFEATLKTGETIELCKGGRHKQVTQENKHFFVELWVDFYMDSSIKRRFAEISAGFHQVFSRCQSIRLFDYEELETLLCGCREIGCYDFKMLRSVTKYAGGLTNDSAVVRWFWEITDEWNISLKRRLLLFVTGSDRVPPTGIHTMLFKISKLGAGDSNRLPIAHTCFNELCLHEYSRKDKLKKKLLWAVTQSEGFAFE